ncbi:PREDICTED: uncharacterized protein LOC104823322 [Tarenaya hassleriana]|uniref:uncharacterized protein LOC104823322 n=1 Tax=Tarenaya hassleriana TaxID=28532 RepID=UPI00053C8F57|nr:PREDICTED: uncharacterized protein LOC104823322 [Tarenaya hassleriana]
MKSCARRPLQPLNGLQQFRPVGIKPKHEPEKNKENHPFDTSLAEELGAFKKKLQRLREDHHSTEQLLSQRDRAMDLHMKHLLERGDFQKKLEIEVDRLFRLKELSAYSSKISPIRPLRERRNCGGHGISLHERETEEEKSMEEDGQSLGTPSPIQSQNERSQVQELDWVRRTPRPREG